MQPPVAPSIAAQQVPMADYARQQAGAGQGGQGGGGTGIPDEAASMSLVQALLTKVRDEFEKIAKVLVVVKPELIPILRQSVNSTGMLMDEVTKAVQPDNGAATQAQAPPASAAVSAAA